MSQPRWILLVEDDANDAQFTVRVLVDPQSPVAVVHVRDGVEAMDCLYHREAFQKREAGLPAMLLLDLKLPRVDGFEVLRQIKNDTVLRTVPVLVFTSSREPSDLARCYQLGTNAYVVKPVDFHQFVEAIKHVGAFWSVINEPPPGSKGESR